MKARLVSIGEGDKPEQLQEWDGTRRHREKGICRAGKALPAKQGGERSEKRQDNPGIHAEFDKKWTNLTLFLVLEMLEYFVWICPILKLFFTLHDMKKSMSELNCPTVHEKLRRKSWSRTEVPPDMRDRSSRGCCRGN